MNQNSRLTEQRGPGKGRKRSRKAAPAETADMAPRDIVPVARVEKAAKETTKEASKPAAAVKRMAGEATEPAAKADPRDRRFADPEWSSNQFFDFLKQTYLLTAQWA